MREQCDGRTHCAARLRRAVAVVAHLRGLAAARDGRGRVPAGHARRAQPIRRLSRRGGRDGAPRGHAGRRHHVRGGVPALQLPLHGAALHAVMHEPGVWLSVVLLLFVGIVVGQLAASHAVPRRDRAATRTRGAGAVPCQPRARDAPVDRGRAGRDLPASWTPRRGMTASGSPVRIERRRRDARRTAQDLPGAQRPPPHAGRRAGAVGARSTRPARAGPRAADARSTACGSRRTRQRSDRSGQRASATPASPIATETRLLSAAADQIGQALTQDRLAAESQAAEIARQSDALKSALLQSVSHDLRTPLATIRAAAGTLASDGLDPRGAPRERPRHRARGRVPQPAGHQPARPEPHRSRRAARADGHVRARRRARRAPSSASARVWLGARSRSTCWHPRSRSTRSSSTRRSRTWSRTCLRHTPADAPVRITRPSGRRPHRSR